MMKPVEDTKLRSKTTNFKKSHKIGNTHMESDEDDSEYIEPPKKKSDMKKNKGTDETQISTTDTKSTTNPKKQTKDVQNSKTNDVVPVRIIKCKKDQDTTTITISKNKIKVRDVMAQLANKLGILNETAITFLSENGFMKPEQELREDELIKDFRYMVNMSKANSLPPSSFPKTTEKTNNFEESVNQKNSTSNNLISQKSVSNINMIREKIIKHILDKPGIIFKIVDDFKNVHSCYERSFPNNVLNVIYSNNEILIKFLISIYNTHKSIILKNIPQFCEENNNQKDTFSQSPLSESNINHIIEITGTKLSKRMIKSYFTMHNSNLERTIDYILNNIEQ